MGGYDEDNDDEGSGNDLTRFLFIFYAVFFWSKTTLACLYYCFFVFSSNMSTPIFSSGYDSGSGNICGDVGDDDDIF